MEDTCLSKSAVTKSLVWLERMGLIKRTKRWLHSRRCESTIYHLIVSEEDYPQSLRKTIGVSLTDQDSARRTSGTVSEKDREPLRRTKIEPQRGDSQVDVQSRIVARESPSSDKDLREAFKRALLEEMGQEKYNTLGASISLAEIVRFPDGQVSGRFSVPDDRILQWWHRNEPLLLRVARPVGIHQVSICKCELEPMID
jgi:hypothetical protein